MAVYRDRPTTEEPQEPVPDWQPDALAELSRVALFSDQFQEVEDEIDKTVAAVGRMQISITRRVADGGISTSLGRTDPESARLQVAALDSEHAALTTVLPDASRGRPRR